MRFPGFDGVSDLELPFPQAGLDLDEAKFNALAVHVQYSSRNIYTRSSWLAEPIRISCHRPMKTCQMLQTKSDHAANDAATALVKRAGDDGVAGKVNRFGRGMTPLSD
jgi:hypothetical protein